MQKAEELAVKLERVMTFLSDHKLAGAVLGRGDNFAWLGCGADNMVDTTGETGVASFLVLRGAVTLVTNNIEADRLQTEELEGLGIRKRRGLPLARAGRAEVASCSAWAPARTWPRTTAPPACPRCPQASADCAIA